MERKSDNTQKVMGIQPASLPLVWTKGEKICKDPPMNDQTSDQSHDQSESSNSSNQTAVGVG